ncbi:UDP-xylose and UDP-N-acetylglucosamine transporter, partial [Operophtera brumata]
MLVYCYAKKQYPRPNNAIGSILITIGVAVAMYGGAPTEQSKGQFLWWCAGVSVLLATLFTGALTGLQQESLYANAVDLQLDMWVIIALSIISQFYCTHSVHELATKENTVTVSFILTLRKFISLLISAVVFKNNFTFLHVIGTVFVGVG